MPIAVRCACGKSIAAPDKYAGQTVKCPGCGAPLAIPAAGSGTAGSGAAAKPASAGPAIYVTCECGRKIAAPAELAGKSTNCPTCRQMVKVPRPQAMAPAGGKTGKDPMAELLEEVDLGRSRTGRRCPECRHDLQPDDILCVQCGFNTETGKQLKTKTVAKKGKGPAGHGHSAPAAPPPSTKTRETAPQAVKSLAKLLNIVGTAGLLIGFLVVAILAFRAYQANPGQDILELVLGLVGSVIPILLGFILLLTVPAAAAASMLFQGQPAGRILAIIVGVLSLPLAGLGALVLRAAFSDDVTDYCR